MRGLYKVFVLRDEHIAKSLYAFLKTNWPSMAKAGTPMQISVSEYKSKRSNEQNRYYWALLNEIAESAWVNGKQFSSDAWHEFFKMRFIGSEELPDGQSIGISTTTLKVGEFSEYCTQIAAYVSTELGVVLPANY